jgi:hypothetical protein
VLIEVLPPYLISHLNYQVPWRDICPDIEIAYGASQKRAGLGSTTAVEAEGEDEEQ